MNLVFLLVNAASAVAVLAAVRGGRLVRREAWLALAVAMTLYTIADAAQIAAGLSGMATLAAGAPGLFVLGYPLFFVAALRFATGARRLDPVVFIDAAIIAIGVGLLTWETVLEPDLSPGLAGDAQVLAIGYPVMAAVLVTLILPLVLIRQTRSWSGILLLTGLAAIGLSDTHFALQAVGGLAEAETFSNIGWLAGSALIGFAAVVPSAAALGTVAVPRAPRRDHVRFLALSLALVIPPLLILRESGTDHTTEVQAFSLAAIGLAMLVILRLQRTVTDLISTDQRFTRFMSHEGFFAAIKDGAGRYLYMNPTAARTSGVAADTWFGRTDLELVAPIVAEQRRRWDDVVRRTGETRMSTVTDGATTWLVSRFPMPDNHGSVGVLGIDVSSQARAEEQLRAAIRATDRWTRERALIAETLATLDAGRTPEETAEAVCARIAQLPETVLASVVTFGIDGIATVIGQAVSSGEAHPGWHLPPERSRYLQERAAKGPWVERWVATPHHPYAQLLAELGVRAHAFVPITRAGEPAGVLIVGSAVPDAVAQLTERLAALAEFSQITSALLGPQLNDRLTEARARAAVREVIAIGAFDIAFQPIVELGTGEIPGYEALARFHDGVEPDAHFRLAREAGLGLELELACLRRALADADRLETGAWLNVNVSPELVLSDALLPLLPRDDRVVVLEITEHEAVTDYAAFRAAIRRLDGRVKVCVDDAGAGYASLRHIVELGPLFVKIDRSLVAGIASDAARQAVVAGMVRFAETAGLTLIAEGIETVEELRLLRLASVPLGQGYLLGRPVVPAAASLPTADLAAEGEAA